MLRLLESSQGAAVLLPLKKLIIIWVCICAGLPRLTGISTGPVGDTVGIHAGPPGGTSTTASTLWHASTTSSMSASDLHGRMGGTAGDSD